MIKKVSLAIASTEEILKDSSGEIINAETINYRSYKPEPDGLFGERIFGPTHNYECYCGKYNKNPYQGVVCSICGVKLTTKKARRKRLGHISLVSPILHIWFFRGFTTQIANLLNLQPEEVEQVINFEKYILLDKGDLEDQLFFLNLFDFLGPRIYHQIKIIIKKKQPNNPPIIKTGAEAFDKILKRININFLERDLREEKKVLKIKSSFKKKSFKDQIKTLNDFIKGKDSYKNIILKIIPVIPPDNRPLVQLDNGKFATSDLNELYRRLLLRNNRLKTFLTIQVPQIIIRNEKRLLQQSVDSLFDNSTQILPLRCENKRVIKALADSFKGKIGRFRFNLLGKRVDYSGRSVIISGPKLKLYECGLPRKMLRELFSPHLLKEILANGDKKGAKLTLKEAQDFLRKKPKKTSYILNYLISKYPILLNRAPTLHKLGIQAFYPKRKEGKAIEIHPLVCAGFNADFDGDQMAVHIPLSNQAILEAKFLLFPNNNIFNPANGDVILVPSQDMLLGLYYLTKDLKEVKPNQGQTRRFFSNPQDVQIAYNNNLIDLHKTIVIINQTKRLYTTVGRVFFNFFLPPYIGYYNNIITKTSLAHLIKTIGLQNNNSETRKFLEEIKDLGFEISFQAGFSFNLEDLIIPAIKTNLLNKACKQKKIKNKLILANIISINNSKYWTRINKKLTKEISSYLKTSQKGFNPIDMMLNSGARSSMEQIRQIAGMRGLMAKPQKNIEEEKNIIENPISSNFLEGLSNWEYFLSAHGARKGLADSALKTAEAGYLTRRLVDVAQKVIIKAKDCKTFLGIKVSPLIRTNRIVEPLYKRCIGRICLQNIYDQTNRKYLVKKDYLIDEDVSKLIKRSNIQKLKVRSPLTCQAKKGICIKCYGINLSNNKLVQKGEAVGILAAQSIGEPGTQLTLRTFHIGGTVGEIGESDKILSNYDGKILFRNIQGFKKNQYQLVISKTAQILIYKLNGKKIWPRNIPYGSKLFLTNNQIIKNKDLIYQWDPDYYPIISEKKGKVICQNVSKYRNYFQETNQKGKEEIIIKKNIHNKRIPWMILRKKEHQLQPKIYLNKYIWPTGSKLLVNNLDIIKEGKILAKIPRKIYKSPDITGGLPRVSELLENRNPLNSSIVSEIGGKVHLGKIKTSNQEIFIKYKKDKPKRYKINIDKKILVNEKDQIKAGTKLSEGEIAINDILKIHGINSFQKDLINSIQEIYRLEGVKINEKHFEIIIRQMLKKVNVIKAGDTNLLVGDIIDKEILEKANKTIKKYKIINSHGKQFLIGEKIDLNQLNRMKNKKKLKTRETLAAIGRQILQGITKSALQNQSFLAAASFQETTKILSESAIKRQKDDLTGLKENVILGNKIPAGTGYNA